MKLINFLNLKEKITFYIPPVYEENRNTIAKEIFDDSLLELNLAAVNLIDHRYLRNKKISSFILIIVMRNILHFS